MEELRVLMVTSGKGRRSWWWSMSWLHERLQVAPWAAGSSVVGGGGAELGFAAPCAGGRVLPHGGRWATAPAKDSNTSSSRQQVDELCLCSTYCFEYRITAAAMDKLVLLYLMH